MWRRGAVVAIVELALPASATALTTNQTVLLDRPSGDAALPYDGAGRGFVQAKSISADGCYVVFVADSDPLFAGDDNGARNLFRYSRCGGPTVVQVNTSSSGVPAEFGTQPAPEPTISDDGNRVAFRADSKTLDPQSDGSPQIYVKDLTSGVLELVSRGESAVGAPVKTAESATISGDGQHVAFVASGVIDTDNVNGVANQYDVFERNMIENTTHMVSVTPANAAGGNVGSDPGISKDGKVVSFSSSAKLAAGDTDSGRDAYVRQGIDKLRNRQHPAREHHRRSGHDLRQGRRLRRRQPGCVGQRQGVGGAVQPGVRSRGPVDVPAAGGSNTSPSANDPTFGHTNGVAPTTCSSARRRHSSPPIRTGGPTSTRGRSPRRRLTADRRHAGAWHQQRVRHRQRPAGRVPGGHTRAAGRRRIRAAGVSCARSRAAPPR